MKVRGLSYFWLDTWVLASIIQLGTIDFCRRFLNKKNDPCGRQYDQMVQAARSGQANIAEGSSRHSTSREAEMRLTDVARASIAELQNDYIFWLLDKKEIPWSKDSMAYTQINRLTLDHLSNESDIIRESSILIISQQKKFEKWLTCNDSIVVANCLLILCTNLIFMLSQQINNQIESFTEEGGFSEALSSERIAFRTNLSIEHGAPLCPKCNSPMLKRIAKKGSNAGNEFWSCSNYPRCNGTRKC